MNRDRQTLTNYKGIENMENIKQDLKALMGIGKNDLIIRAIVSPVKTINYRAVCDLIGKDLREVLSCYDESSHLTVASNYLKVYCKNLSDSQKGYILINSKVSS